MLCRANESLTERKRRQIHCPDFFCPVSVLDSLFSHDNLLLMDREMKETNAASVSGNTAINVADRGRMAVAIITINIKQNVAN